MCGAQPLLVLAAPHLHGFRIVLDLAVVGIEVAVRDSTSQAMLESCSMVTATLPTATGALSFSPFRMPAMKLAKCRSVMESRPVRSADEVAFAGLELRSSSCP